jgi:hypothetical protein
MNKDQKEANPKRKSAVGKDLLLWIQKSNERLLQKVAEQLTGKEQHMSGQARKHVQQAALAVNVNETFTLSKRMLNLKNYFATHMF